MVYDPELCRKEHDERMNKVELDLQSVKDNVDVLKESIKKQDKILSDIQELSTSVSILANNMKSMLDEQRNQSSRLAELERKPARRWEAVVDKVLMLGIAGLVTFLLVRLGLA